MINELTGNAKSLTWAAHTRESRHVRRSWSGRWRWRWDWTDEISNQNQSAAIWTPANLHVKIQLRVAEFIRGSFHPPETTSRAPASAEWLHVPSHFPFPRERIGVFLFRISLLHIFYLDGRSRYNSKHQPSRLLQSSINIPQAPTKWCFSVRQHFGICVLDTQYQ